MSRRAAAKDFAMSRLAAWRIEAAQWPWGDIIEALVVFTIFFGVVFGFAYATGAFEQTVAQKNEELKKMGVSVSSTGVAIKTDKRGKTQEEIADKMQRSAAKTAASGAISFRSGAGAGDPAAAEDPSLPMSRSTSKPMSRAASKVS